MKLVAVYALAAALLGGAHRPDPHPQPRPEPHVELGVLDVESEPSAEIAIDGASTGLWTPQHHLRLAPGHHKVTFYRRERERRPSTYGITIQPGQTTHLTVHLAF